MHHAASVNALITCSCRCRSRVHRRSFAARHKPAASADSAAAGAERVVRLEDLLQSLSDDEDDSMEQPWEAQVSRIASAMRTDAEAAQSPSLAQSMLATASQSLPPVTSAYSTEGGFHTVTAADLCCELVGPQPPLVVDIREATDFAQGHVPGAVSVPLSQLSDAARRGNLGGRDAALVVVGNNDRLSQQANVRLRRVCGFSNVRSLAGDVDGWASLGLPLDANH